ncbi:MAG: cell division topological specificity factor MinE [Phototrophicales bacterium]|nr:MAG: cell division topological specificity factor MinE [Phototrophicales bacterium]
MANLIDRFLGRSSQPKSAKIAKERLQFVLVTDRSQLSPEKLRQMQAEILDVIRKYYRINEEGIDIKIESRERENYLVADIPLAKQNPNSDEDGGRIGFMLQTPAQTLKSESDESSTETDASAEAEPDPPSS